MEFKIKNITHASIYLLITASIMLVSCESFFQPKQGLIVEENSYFNDWNEYRAAELGLYSLQQDLVTQLVVLGELRADLLNVTENADRDLREVATFQLTPGQTCRADYNPAPSRQVNAFPGRSGPQRLFLHMSVYSRILPNFR